MEKNVPHILQGRKLLRRNAVYIDYPILDENGSVQATRGKRLAFFFDKHDEALAARQEKLARRFMIAEPNRFCSGSLRYNLKADYDNPELKEELAFLRQAHPDLADAPDQAVFMLLSDQWPAASMMTFDLNYEPERFESLFGRDIGTRLHVSEDQVMEKYRHYDALRKEALAFFGGREKVPTVELDVLLETQQAQHDRYLDLFLSGEDPEPGGHEGSFMTEILPAHVVATMYYEDGYEFLKNVQLAFLGLPSGYTVTRQHNITQTRS